MNYKKEIRRIYKALGLNDIHQLKIERSVNELETHQSTKAEERGETTLRQLDSTSTASSEEEEAPTTESETGAITFDKDIYILTGRKQYNK